LGKASFRGKRERGGRGGKWRGATTPKLAPWLVVWCAEASTCCCSLQQSAHVQSFSHGQHQGRSWSCRKEQWQRCSSRATGWLWPPTCRGSLGRGAAGSLFPGGPRQHMTAALLQLAAAAGRSPSCMLSLCCCAFEASSCVCMHAHHSPACRQTYTCWHCVHACPSCLQVFFAAVGASADIRLVLATAPILFGWSFVALGGHLALLLGLGRLAGFSRKELLLASNANIGGERGSREAGVMGHAREWGLEGGRSAADLACCWQQRCRSRRRCWLAVRAHSSQLRLQQWCNGRWLLHFASSTMQ
jgi:hypothetical protein